MRTSPVLKNGRYSKARLIVEQTNRDGSDTLWNPKDGASKSGHEIEREQRLAPAPRAE